MSNLSCCRQCKQIFQRKARLQAKRILYKHASTSSSSHTSQENYAFPKTPQPTPYQIFHLPKETSFTDVKQRYYELVRIYHPDAPYARSREPDAAVRHARFRAITAAYDKLKVDFEQDNYMPSTSEDGGKERQRWRRAGAGSFVYGSRNAFDERRSIDERWKDRLIWGALGLVVFSTCFQYVTVRQGNVKEAMDSRQRQLTSWQEGRRRKAQDPQS